MLISRIIWETNGEEEVNLPKEVEVPCNVKGDDEIADWLSNEYGFLVVSYSREMQDGEEDEFGLYVNEVEGKVS